MLKKKDVILFNYKKIRFKIFNTNFGVIDVSKLIKLKTELELFNFYIKYKNNYKTFADVGANVGIHSLLVSRIFKKVYSFEPLQDHFDILKKNILLNRFKNIKIFKKAISKNNKDQVLNILTKNTTATHLNIATRSKYGMVLKKVVKCISINKINSKIDLIKLDVEGLESELIKKINFKKNFSDFILEVHNQKNARDIFKKLSKSSNLAIYKLKNSKLKLINKFKDMPSATKDGSLFITKSNFKI